MADPKPEVYTPEAVEAKIAESGLEGWYYDPDGGWLRRKYATDGWQATLMLVNAVGYLCEAAWHHADLSVTWGKVWVSSRPTRRAGSPTRTSPWRGRSRRPSCGAPSRAGPWRGRRTGSCRGRSEPWPGPAPRGRRDVGPEDAGSWSSRTRYGDAALGRAQRQALLTTPDHPAQCGPVRRLSLGRTPIGTTATRLRGTRSRNVGSTHARTAGGMILLRFAGAASLALAASAAFYPRWPSAVAGGWGPSPSCCR